MSSPLLKIFSRLSNLYLRRYQIKDPSASDVYLVSYPKSGNTWLSFLIANCNISLLDSSLRVTWFNIHSLVPDVHLSRSSPAPTCLSNSLHHRFIKSHSTLNPHYASVIYLSRHPVDTLASYYRMTRQLGHHTLTPSQFIRHRRFGVHSWAKHVISWFTQSDPGVSFHHVRYEDLVLNAFRQLSLIYDSLGYSLHPDCIQQSIYNSNFSSMKHLETSQGYGGRPVSNYFTFVGSKTDLSYYFSENDVKYILDSTVYARTLIS